MIRLALVALLLAACEHHNPTDTQDPSKPADDQKPAIMPAPSSPIQVDWSLSRAGAALDLHYTIANHTSAPIWVLDQIVTTGPKGLAVLPDRVIVRRGPDTNTASFVLGFTRQQGHAVAYEPSPVAHSLAPGATLTGTKHVPLPIASWHPYDSMIDPLQSAPTHAVFEVSWLPEAPPSGVPGWEDAPAEGSGTLHLPTINFIGTSAQLATGPTLAIP
jgi:hypothetical protein